jgi:hypothetical protein
MSSNEGERKFFTNDTRMSQAEEERLLESGTQQISVEEFIRLGKLARERKVEFEAVAAAGMTVERALRIRELRRTSSWRTIASITFKEWGADAMWEPESNQLAGMALCETAALLLDEDPEKTPWQSRQ